MLLLDDVFSELDHDRACALVELLPQGQTLINDDLDAFTRIPAMYGNSIAQLESDVVWGIITANPGMADGNALFHTTQRTWPGLAPRWPSMRWARPVRRWRKSPRPTPSSTRWVWCSTATRAGSRKPAAPPSHPVLSYMRGTCVGLLEM